MSTVNVGVIGAGWWGTFAHIPAIQSHPQANLLSVQSLRREDAQRVARDFGAKHAFTDVHEMLSLKGLDAVVISSTPNVHYEQAKAALERRLHVLLEKPMTIRASEAQELVHLADAHGCQLLISSPWHYTAHGRKAQDLIRSGGLGRIKMISVLMTNPVGNLLKGRDTTPVRAGTFRVKPEPGSYSDPAIAGGGQIYCQVSHVASYLTFLTGHRPSEVFARFDHDGCAVDIYDSLSLVLEGGELVSLASTAAVPNGTRQYEVRVYGTEGVLLMELWRGTLTYAHFDGRQETFPALAPHEIYPEQAPARNLIDTLLGRESNGSPGVLGLAAMEVIEAACTSARSGNNIVIR